MLKSDEKARELIQNRVKKGLLGPGSDVWGVDESEEIISDYPLQRYFTGILFPEKRLYEVKDEFELDQAEVENETTKYDEDEDINYDNRSDEDINLNNKKIEESFQINKNNFFPNNMGLSFALKNDVKELSVKFRFGLYYQPKLSDIKIKISEEGFKSFFDENIKEPLSFKNLLEYKDGFMFLSKPLEGNKRGSKNQRSGHYKDFDEFRKKENIKGLNVEKYIIYLEKILGRVWKRKNFDIEELISISNTEKPKKVILNDSLNKDIKVAYNIKIFPKDGINYVKIQLINQSESQSANKFSIKNESLNSKCFFQSSIEIVSDKILPYKQNQDFSFLDQEAKEIEFIYRDIKNYAVGHNCSIEWLKENNSIKLNTSFLPKQDIKDIINNFEDTSISSVLNVRNLSIWGLERDSLIKELNNFVDSYKNWITKQEEDNQKLSLDEIDIGIKIIEKQKYNYECLKKNIELLKDDKVFKAFQIANTAMLIQMIISIDEDFCKIEKEINEINNKINFTSLDFFNKYNKFSPQYRPFQLAFLLLSIDGILNPENHSRKDIVDLIWFPTGGGKTEAYLAVTAFTIAYRRIANEKGYEGTTVIMRYTLRLLTAQQFERASRLITSLEFLRNQKEFEKDLKNTPISIGLWVGQASTPNKIEEVKKALTDIETECNKKDLSGDPSSKNVFQISSCPWCGTKIVSQENNIWKYGFEESKKEFKIYCINKKCFFNKKIPVQVVDEMLYKNPPTLLFGTVDKFAMLSWQEDGHNFFNSFNDSLAPDLIIQDELHLLSGPLGSIVGIYESVIEMLCTKNDRKPKIIASTATTRNTEHQIESLYGNRKVNVFPPSGIKYDDNYFSRESSSESKRRYLGIIPTGKTVIDTQLQLLAHLFIARLEIFINEELKETIDNYWTIVSYYNSLKEVGKIYNKVNDEISNSSSTLQHRLSVLFHEFEELIFNHSGISSRTKELTSRIESSKIKSVLKEIESNLTEEKFSVNERNHKYLNNVVDLVLATNMISVGIDISRLNIMLLNGMPKNIAEYIQASSRVGRKTQGLVITLFDPNRAREKSYFENFKNFHQAFYKYVEPLSITPFTQNTINKMLSSMVVSYIRNKVPNLSKNKDVVYFKADKLNYFKEFISKRFSNSEDLDFFKRKLDTLTRDWEKKINDEIILSYKSLLKTPSESDETSLWRLMQSLREIDTNTYIQIKEDFGND